MHARTSVRRSSHLKSISPPTSTSAPRDQRCAVIPPIPESIAEYVCMQGDSEQGGVTPMSQAILVSNEQLISVTGSELMVHRHRTPRWHRHSPTSPRRGARLRRSQSGTMVGCLSRQKWCLRRMHKSKWIKFHHCTIKPNTSVSPIFILILYAFFHGIHPRYVYDCATCGGGISRTVETK